MTAHTPGRLAVHANGDANSYRLVDDGGAWWLAVLMNGEQRIEQQENNTRRLAVCWNSWVGVSTEDIEALGGVARFNGEPVGELAAALAELETANRRIASLEADVTVASALFSDVLAAHDGGYADDATMGRIRALLG